MRYRGALDRLPRPDRAAVGATIGLMAAGLLALAAATLPAGAGFGYLARQAVADLLGIAALVAVTAVPPRRLLHATPWLYAAGLGLLAAVLGLGTEVRGTRGWFDLVVFRFQPAEAAKPVVVLALARLLGSDLARSAPYAALAGATALVGLPAGLILQQPDLGTTATLAGLLLAMPYAAGLPVGPLLFVIAAGGAFVGRLVAGLAVDRLALLPVDSAAALFLTDARAAALVVAAALGGCAVATALWGPRRTLPIVATLAAVSLGTMLSFPVEGRLKEYQALRLLAFVSPQADPRGASYNVIQSMIAIGAGGVRGRGIGGATQTALGFLPERQTDFIFSVIGEAFGLVGALAVIALYILLLWRLLVVSARAEGLPAALVPVGVATLLGIHLGVNVGMGLGLVPVMGIPLPLVSYGGSAALSTAVAIGVALAMDPEARSRLERAERAALRRVRAGIELGE